MSETAWGTRLDRRACATGVTAPGATRRGNPTRRAGREAPPRRETATRPDRPPPTVFPTNASDCMTAVVRRAREEARLGVKRSLREGCDGRVCLNANQRTLRTWSRPCVCLGTHPTSASPGGERCRKIGGAGKEKDPDVAPQDVRHARLFLVRPMSLRILAGRYRGIRNRGTAISTSPREILRVRKVPFVRTAYGVARCIEP